MNTTMQPAVGPRLDGHVLPPVNEGTTTAPRERPILFSAPMVRAILAGTKTQTRRMVKPVGNDGGFVLVEQEDASMWPHRSDDGESCFVTRRERDGQYLDDVPMRCPYGRPGDRLWVRETYMPDPPDDGTWAGTAWRGCKGARLEDIPERFRSPSRCLYRSTWTGSELVGWRPSIHMPRWASRITLEVTGVRVERLQDISAGDCISEGIGFEVRYGGHCLPDGSHFHASDPRQSYWSLWEAINGPGSVEADPWVWVVEFRQRQNASLNGARAGA